MKIFYQESENDCGISVTRALVNYYLKKEISRTEIFDQVNISERGISIFELEAINKKYGIHLETYKLSLKELQEIPIKGFFVMLLYRNNFEHFVIAKKYKSHCTLYDSELGKFKVNYQQLESIFSGKISIIEKINPSSKSQITVNYSTGEISILKLPRLARNILLELVIFSLLIISFAINKLIFEDVIQSNYLGNISSIIFVSVLVVLIWALLEYIKSIYYLKDKTWYFKELYQILLDRLEKKKNYFFSKLSKNQYLLIQEYTETISLFYSELLIMIIANAIIVSLISLYLIYLQVWFLALIVLITIIKLINFQILRKLDNQNIEKIIRNKVNVQKLIYKLNQFLQQEWDFGKFSSLNSSLNSEVTEWQLNNKFFHTKKELFLKLNFFITQLVNCSIYFIGTYLYFQKEITIASIILAGIAYMQLSSAIDKLILNGSHWAKHCNAITQFKHLLFNDNLPLEGKCFSKETITPETIELKNLSYHNGEKTIFNNLNLSIKNNSFISGPSGIGKSTLYKLIAAKLPDAIDSIFINKTSLADLWDSSLNQLIIYQNSKSEALKLDWTKLSQVVGIKKSKKLVELSERMGINNYHNFNEGKLSDGQRQFVNLLYLCTLSKKILLLDEITSHINSSNREIIFQELFPLIFEKNFVVCSEHDLNLKHFFSNHIDLGKITLIS